MIFIDTDVFNRRKDGMCCSGDIFVSRRIAGGKRVCAVLADGLGSGLQANVAASLTATMALEYITSEDVEIRHAAEMIMDALPLCPERHISYSTFTMVSADTNGHVRLIEYGNPPVLLMRGKDEVSIARTELTLPRWNGRTMAYATFTARLGDRIVFCSDGVTQAGLGSYRYPFGWGRENLSAYVSACVAEHPDLGAEALAPQVVRHALEYDNGISGDDITCAVMYYRKTKTLQILTGPPFAKDKDHAYASLILNPDTTSVVCGGTTAELVGRELKRPLTMTLTGLDPEVPATSTMEGAAIVTEGCITLSFVAKMLESGNVPPRKNGATILRELMLSHDRINFFVGTGINPAHQDPNLPVELEIRRTLIKRLAKLLEEQYYKEVTIQFF